MPGPQHKQLEVDSTKLSTETESMQACIRNEQLEEEQQAKPLMWSKWSMAAPGQREVHHSDITSRNTPRYIGNFEYPEDEVLPWQGEESVYSFGNFTFTKPSEQGSISDSSAPVGQDTQHHQSEDDTSVHLKSTYSLGETSSTGRGPFLTNRGGLSGQIIVTSNVSLVTRASCDNVDISNSEVRCRTQDLGSRSSEIITEEPISALVNKVPQDVSLVPTRELAFPEVLEVSLKFLALDDTSSGESLASDTDMHSAEELPAESSSAIPWELEELEDTAPLPRSSSRWPTTFTTHTGHEGRGSKSGNTSRHIHHSASTSSSSNYSNKRTVNDREKRISKRDDDPPELPGSDTDESEDGKNPVKLACPFFKHDPARYNPRDYHTCATSTWDSFNRLKQHLQRTHIARTSCETCEQKFDSIDALEDHLEMSSCNSRQARYLVGMTSIMAERIKKRWRKAPTREKWERMCSILFPEETIPSPDFDTDKIGYLPLGQSQRMPRLEKDFLHKLKYALKMGLDRSANHHINILPDDAKIELVEDMFEECVLQLKLGKISPKETPRMPVPPGEGSLHDRTVIMNEQLTDYPIEKWISLGGEGSNYGLGLSLLPFELPPSLPARGRSSTCPDQPNCFCLNGCECPPRQSSFFEEQYIAPRAFDEDDQWSDINGSNSGHIGPNTF